MTWSTYTLGELTASTRPICYGVLKPGEFIDDGIPLVRVTDISQNEFDPSSLYKISAALDKEFARSRLEGGEILLSIQGTVGRVAIVPPEMKGANISRTIAVISPDNRVHRPYLYHYLRRLGDTCGFYISGTTRASLNISELRDIKIPLPPLEEQRRIAAILDKANEILNFRRKSLERVKSLTNSVFLEMFGNPFSIGSGHSHVPFRDMTERITYGFTSPMAHEDSGIPILTAKNIQDGFIDLGNVHYARQDEFEALTSKCKPAPGDILITKDGSIGRCAIAPAEGPLCINQSVALIIPDRSRVTPEYVSAYIRCAPVQQRIQRMGKGNALKHLQITELAEFPSLIPPLEDQKSFAGLMAAINQRSEKSKAGVSQAEKMAQSLCFSLFERTYEKYRDRIKESDC